MDEIVTCKLETYINLLNKINALESDLKYALNEVDIAKEKINNLSKVLIEENTNSGFDGASIEDIKSKQSSCFIYYCIYKPLKYFYTDNEIKDILLVIKKEQANEKDN